jgi:hypothetical protein
VAQLVTQQKFHQDAVSKSAKAEDEWAKAVQKARDAAADNVTALQDRATALEQELATYGLTKSEIEDTIIARLEEQKAMTMGLDSQEELIANLEKEIDARKRARDAMQGVEAKDTAKKAAEDAADLMETADSRRERQQLVEQIVDLVCSGKNAG